MPHGSTTPPRGARRLALSAAFAVALSSCGDNPSQGEFRYRLSFSVDVNGVVETASSIIGVRYWGGRSDMTTSAVSTYSDWEGIAPVIKIGQHGWLVAAMMANNARFERLKGPNPPNCPETAGAAGFPGIFDKTPAELSAMKAGKRQLPEQLYPSFIWIPANASYLDAAPVCPDEFSRVIGGKVELRSVTVEVAKDAPLLTLQPFEAPWLTEIREEQGERYSGGPYFKIVRQRQIETQTIRSNRATY